MRMCWVGMIDFRYEFYETIDLGPYTASEEPATYRLVSVMSHTDWGRRGGHYRAYIDCSSDGSNKVLVLCFCFLLFLLASAAAAASA